MHYYRIGAPASSETSPPPRPIGGWETFLRDGEGYLRTALNAHSKRKKVFTPEILYNMASMAMEKFFMAALMRHGTMPLNHTMIDMMTAMEQTFPQAVADIRDAVIALDKYQQICDPFEYTVDPPHMDEIPAVLNLADRVHQLVADELTPPYEEPETIPVRGTRYGPQEAGSRQGDRRIGRHGHLPCLRRPRLPRTQCPSSPVRQRR